MLSAVVFLLSSGSLLGVFEFTAAHEQYNEPIYEAFGAGSLLPCDGSAGEGECYAGGSPRTEAWYPDEFWFWWRASRIIPGAITEFPAFSFVLGDLHPHLMAIPGVLLAVAIAAVTWRGRGALDWTAYRDSPWLLPLIAVVFGALAFQNTWDVLTFSALFALAVVARNIRAGPPGLALLASVRFLVPAGVLAVLIFSPWWWFFSSQASGLYAYTGEGTRPAHALLQYGPLGIPALGLLVAARSWRRSSDATNAALLALWVPLLPAIAWLALAVARGEGAEAMQGRGAGGWVTLAVLAATAWLFASGTLLATARRTSLAAPFALATLGVLLIYGSELLLVRDVFFGSVPRLNTVFKLTFQAWILLAIAAAVAVPLLLARAREGVPAAAAWLVPVAVVFSRVALLRGRSAPQPHRRLRKHHEYRRPRIPRAQ
ncbi:MAG: DUF2298 domain-containing protein [Dehalococcoidia bacterium]|nr:DUF2298 domain-containing protein [Dehalococcoidia bacterium]